MDPGGATCRAGACSNMNPLRAAHILRACRGRQRQMETGRGPQQKRWYYGVPEKQSDRGWME